jgi:hypothetical protein
MVAGIVVDVAGRPEIGVNVEKGVVDRVGVVVRYACTVCAAAVLLASACGVSPPLGRLQAPRRNAVTINRLIKRLGMFIFFSFDV